MRFFLDTEFIERGREHPIQLVSIGIVCEGGGEYYAVSAEYDAKTASKWVKVNVLSHVGEGERKPLQEIAKDVQDFVDENGVHGVMWRV